MTIGATLRIGVPTIGVDCSGGGVFVAITRGATDRSFGSTKISGSTSIASLADEDEWPKGAVTAAAPIDISPASTWGASPKGTTGGPSASVVLPARRNGSGFKPTSLMAST